MAWEKSRRPFSTRAWVQVAKEPGKNLALLKDDALASNVALLKIASAVNVALQKDALPVKVATSKDAMAVNLSSIKDASAVNVAL